MEEKGVGSTVIPSTPYPRTPSSSGLASVKSTPYAPCTPYAAIRQTLGSARSLRDTFNETPEVWQTPQPPFKPHVPAQEEAQEHYSQEKISVFFKLLWGGDDFSEGNAVEFFQRFFYVLADETKKSSYCGVGCLYDVIENIFRTVAGSEKEVAKKFFSSLTMCFLQRKFYDLLDKTSGQIMGELNLPISSEYHSWAGDVVPVFIVRFIYIIELAQRVFLEEGFPWERVVSKNKIWEIILLKKKRAKKRVESIKSSVSRIITNGLLNEIRLSQMPPSVAAGRVRGIPATPMTPMGERVDVTASALFTVLRNPHLSEFDRFTQLTENVFDILGLQDHQFAAGDSAESFETILEEKLKQQEGEDEVNYEGRLHKLYEDLVGLRRESAIISFRAGGFTRETQGSNPEAQARLRRVTQEFSSETPEYEVQTRVESVYSQTFFHLMQIFNTLCEKLTEFNIEITYSNFDELIGSVKLTEEDQRLVDSIEDNVAREAARTRRGEGSSSCTRVAARRLSFSGFPDGSPLSILAVPRKKSLKKYVFAFLPFGILTTAMILASVVAHGVIIPVIPVLFAKLISGSSWLTEICSSINGFLAVTQIGEDIAISGTPIGLFLFGSFAVSSSKFCKKAKRFSGRLDVELCEGRAQAQGATSHATQLGIFLEKRDDPATKPPRPVEREIIANPASQEPAPSPEPLRPFSPATPST
jgi:hypothetical protein